MLNWKKMCRKTGERLADLFDWSIIQIKILTYYNLQFYIHIERPISNFFLKGMTFFFHFNILDILILIKY